jgi:hypothetical protein
MFDKGSQNVRKEMKETNRPFSLDETTNQIVW